MTLSVSGHQFLLNGSPLRILSGAMHYFRVMPAAWRDRLEKMRAFGLNTVETYVAWNLHEPRPGQFHFDGMLDIVRYIETAAEVGLNVIVRPGPYICSEWEMGGLPSWLLKDPHLQVRCMYPPYLEAVDRFFDALLPHLAPLQSTRGGPLIALQVENEYGSYGNDKAYLQYLADGMRRRGRDSLLFTSDGPGDGYLQGGMLPGLLPTVNFAFDAPDALAKLRQYLPEGPLMVTEFWSGWFDHWGNAHAMSADSPAGVQRSAHTLDEILAGGASVNFYMFHGGSNFGFMNGANLEPEGYRSDVTSYDYAAPLDEAGDPAPRYAAYHAVLVKHGLARAGEIPAPGPKAAYGALKMQESAGLFALLAALSQKHTSVTPQSMEMYDQDYGFILYRTHISGPRPAGVLQIHPVVCDRAQVFLDGQAFATLERETGNACPPFAVPPEGVTLDLLVENMGRVNYGPGLRDRKGILDGVTFAGQFQMGWEVYPLPLADLSRLQFAPILPAAGQGLPAFYRAVFTVDAPADTFLALPGWSKGVAWVNGFNLGRYWERGPQQTLYVPASLLRAGRNELVIFELHGAGQAQVEFRDRPDLG